MIIFRKIAGFARYLFNKRTEIERLSGNDILLAKVILDIHRTKVRTEFVIVPLYALSPIHPIDRGAALEATEKRAATIAQHRDEIIDKRIVDRELLNKYLTSVSWIKVVEVMPDRFISFEGNGRIEALKRNFTSHDKVMVEVECYTVSNPRTIQRRIARVRYHNGAAKNDTLAMM